MKTQLFTKLTVKAQVDTHRVFNHVKAGNYYLSIQGSMFHYCKPQETIDYELYEEMEVGIIGKKKHLLNIKRIKVLKQFNRYEELIERLSGKTVIAYAPIDLINDLYNFLCKQMKTQIKLTIEKDSENAELCSYKCKFAIDLGFDDSVCQIWQRKNNWKRVKECLEAEK